MLDKQNSTALIFPGQGSQFVGMGKELYEAYPQAKAVYDEVDDALGENLSQLIFDGDELILNQTSNTQPAIMATSIAVLRVLEHRLNLKINQICKLVAGHSLGEYSAHAAVNTFTLADTARLLRARGNAMQNAVPAGKGGMVALVGADMESVTKICNDASSYGLCQIANDNGAGQVVISGAVQAMEHVVSSFKSYGIRRAVMLPVSAPFHCEWMLPAAKVMESELGKVSTNASLVPVLTNVDVKPITSADDAIKALVAQVAGQVRWRESVDFMVSNNITNFIEVGPGKVLGNLIGRIEKSANVSSVCDIESIDKLIGANA